MWRDAIHVIRHNTLRVVAVIGLVSAGFFASLPWLGCAFWGRINGTLTGYADMARLCTFGFPGIPGPQYVYGLPGFTGPYWGNLIVGAAYLVAAVYVAVARRF
jgi:hypothetical protein